METEDLDLSRFDTMALPIPKQQKNPIKDYADRNILAKTENKKVKIDELDSPRHNSEVMSEKS